MRPGPVGCQARGSKGLLELAFSAFAVDGRPELGVVAYSPASAAMAERVWGFLASREA